MAGEFETLREPAREPDAESHETEEDEERDGNPCLPVQVFPKGMAAPPERNAPAKIGCSEDDNPPSDGGPAHKRLYRRVCEEEVKSRGQDGRA